MARGIRKTPKPKMPTYERIDPKSDPQEVYPLLADLRVKHKPELEEAKIALAWRHGWKRNKDGQLILGKCKKVSDLDKQFQGFDFIIILNKESWAELDDSQRKALLHHELCHAAVALDPNGNPKKDARGRQMFRVKKHDIEEFGEIVEHHGCYKQDLENFVLTALRSKRPPQPALPGLVEPSTTGSTTEAVEAPPTIPMASAATRRVKPKPRAREQ